MIKSPIKYRLNRYLCSAVLAAGSLMGGLAPAQAQNQKPNIILILSDDFGYGDSGPYGGGENRGMPTPSLDRLAAEGMHFLSFYAQPSCTPGRAAVQTGRIPNYALAMAVGVTAITLVAISST